MWEIVILALAPTPTDHKTPRILFSLYFVLFSLILRYSLYRYSLALSSPFFNSDSSIPILQFRFFNSDSSSILSLSSIYIHTCTCTLLSLSFFNIPITHTHVNLIIHTGPPAFTYALALNVEWCVSSAGRHWNVITGFYIMYEEQKSKRTMDNNRQAIDNDRQAIDIDWHYWQLTREEPLLYTPLSSPFFNTTNATLLLL